MTPARDEFFRRYATSPIHIPRLERWLAVYDEAGDAGFSERFVAWDRACPDAEAARIVAEIMSAGDRSGQIVRFNDETIRGAIRWMGEATSIPIAERMLTLRETLSAGEGEGHREFLAFLEASVSLDDARFQATAASMTRKHPA